MGPLIRQDRIESLLNNADLDRMSGLSTGELLEIIHQNEFRRRKTGLSGMFMPTLDPQRLQQALQIAMAREASLQSARQRVGQQLMPAQAIPRPVP